MTIETERRADGEIVRISGDIRLSNRPDEEQKLVSECAQLLIDGDSLLLNLSQVTALDSIGIGVLARFRFRWTASGHVLRVILPDGIPGEALRAMHIFEDCVLPKSSSVSPVS